MLWFVFDGVAVVTAVAVTDTDCAVHVVVFVVHFMLLLFALLLLLLVSSLMLLFMLVAVMLLFLFVLRLPNLFLPLTLLFSAVVPCCVVCVLLFIRLTVAL